MMRDLKEHGTHSQHFSTGAVELTSTFRYAGMVYFLNEYVVKQAIPIPKLLYAFGVCLVRAIIRCQCPRADCVREMLVL